MADSQYIVIIQISQNNSCLRTVFALCIISTITLLWLSVGLAIHRNITNNNSVHKRLSVGLNVSEIRKQITLINQEEAILNEDKFGPIQNDSLVIAVQVHYRIEYLKHLIESLHVSREISSVLLIFSHDVFDENINRLVRAIDFCRVMQIFYPFSTQIHPDRFPGAETNTCLWNTSEESHCENKIYVDNQGVPRNPELVQVKHHWWWKAHKIFALKTLRSYKGLVLFLEEDMYVVEDFISVLKLMENSKPTLTPACKIFSLSRNLQAVDFARFDGSLITKAELKNHFSNMGLAFTRDTWKEILKCKFFFCLRNEYNWDFSLQNVFTTCMDNATAMTLISPRVYHLGVCGVHFKSEICDPKDKLLRLNEILIKHKKRLYPKKIFLIYNFGQPPWDSEFGGWFDPRDHALCYNMSARGS